MNYVICTIQTLKIVIWVKRLMTMMFLLPVRNWIMNVMKPRIGYIARLLNQIFARTVKALPLLPVISILPPWENLLYGDMAMGLPEKIVWGQFPVMI